MVDFIFYLYIYFNSKFHLVSKIVALAHFVGRVNRMSGKGNPPQKCLSIVIMHMGKYNEYFVIISLG